jgi:hypothetical protein
VWVCYGLGDEVLGRIWGFVGVGSEVHDEVGL